MVLSFFFFFSSRRRHTRCLSDWSSDVCSSDLTVSGLLVGLAGAYQVLGQTTSGFTNDFDAQIGFNAITVALLGRSRPWGVFLAGILFGVFTNGGYTMQAANSIDLNIVSVV